MRNITTFASHTVNLPLEVGTHKFQVIKIQKYEKMKMPKAMTLFSLTKLIY